VRLPTERVFTGNVAVLSVTTAANVAAQMVWYPILPLVYRRLGASDFEVSLAYGLLAVAVAAFQVAGGALADRLGRKPLIAWPTFVAAAAVATAGFAPSWPLLTFCLAVMNVCTALQVPSFVALIAESCGEGREGRAFALLELFASLGVGLGPALGALVLPVVPDWGLFVLSGAVYAVSGTARLLGLRETSRPPVAGAAPAHPLAAPGPAAFLRGRLGRLTLTAVAVTAVSNLSVYGPFIPLLAHDRIGLDARHIDILYTVGPLVSAASGLAMGRLVDRRGPGPALAVGALGAGAALSALVWSRSFWSALVLVSVAAAAVQLVYVAYDALRASAAGPEHRGRVVGVLGMLGGLAGAGLLPVAGRLASAGGPGAGVALAAAFCVLAAVAGLRAGRDRP